MAVRPIVTLGNPLLAARAQLFDLQHGDQRGLTSLISDLVDTMLEAKGVGIAAPQIGVGLRVAIVHTKEKPLVIINPEITKRSIRASLEEEGCLSVPGVFGMVRRPKEITVAYDREDGTRVKEKIAGFLARVFQHEIDHLNGTLFTDKVTSITQGKLQ